VSGDGEGVAISLGPRLMCYIISYTYIYTLYYTMWFIASNWHDVYCTCLRRACGPSPSKTP